jgi:hypothetical protein
MNVKQLPSGWLRRLLFPLLRLIIPLLGYAIVFLIGVPTEISLDARYGFLTLVILTCLLLYPTFRLSGWIEMLASLSLTLILFALPLLALWTSGISDASLIGGLLPWSDASGYYWDAKRVLEGGIFSDFSSRRPLFPGMLATLLGLTQQNLQVTLAILVAITAISCWLAAREVQRSHGTAAGLMVLTIQFMYYRRFIGKTLTEHLGLALGAVGFALLWRGAHEKQIHHCLLGILLLTLALNARAGTFFILPAILLWGLWSFRGTARFSHRFLIGGASAVWLGFILNSILLKVIGSPEGLAFSNFSYTLYGLIRGGDWTQVMVEHPELNIVKEPELSKRIYALALEALLAHPLSLLSGSLRAWRLFIFDDFVFSFVRNLKINFILQIFSFVGLFACYRRKQNPNNFLILATTLGILISVPFIPPWDSEEMRVYAATLPFICILPALGLTFMAKKMEWQRLVQRPNQENQPEVLLIFGIALALFSVLGPITTKALSRTPQYTGVSCKPGMEAVYLRLTPGSSINLVADNAIQKTRLPSIRLSDFKNRMDGNGFDNFNILYPELTKELTNLSPSTTIVNTFNLNNSKQIWLISDSKKMPEDRVIVGVCGKMSTNPHSEGYGFFYAETIQTISTIDNN